MKRFIYLVTFLFLLTGCAMVNSYFDGRALNKLTEMTEITETEVVLENMTWAVERLAVEDEYAPDILAKLLPLARKKAEEFNLDQLDPTLYNLLIERYSSIALDGVSTTDKERWEKNGYRYSVTNDYLRASSAYQLGKLKGDAIASQLLVLLRKLDSPAIQAVLLKSMLERVDAYKENDEIRAQAISALSNVDIRALEPDSVLASQLAKLEGELATLPLINRVLSKKDIYQLTERNLTYLLDLNEGIWLYLLKNPDQIDKNEVVTNTRLLSSLALPAEEHLDGTVPDYSVVEKDAQRLLLQYAPGLYYFSMFNHAKTSDYSFGQLLATKQYMDRYETYAKTAKESIVATGDEERLFFNHHVLMNKTIYSQTAVKTKKMVFDSLFTRVESRPLEYIDFIYSYLNVNYSKDFAIYLLNRRHQKYRLAGVDMLQHYYALTLTTNDAISSNGKKQLLALVKNAQLDRTLKYTDSEMKDYVERVYPTFIEKDSAALLSQLHAKYRNVSKQKGIHEITDYYVVALDNIDVKKRGSYLNFAGSVIALYDESSTKKLMGAYRQIPLSSSANSLKNIAFKDMAKIPTEYYVYLGNYITHRKKEINSALTKTYGGIFNSVAQSHKNDDTALIAAQQGMINFESMRPTFNRTISKRLEGVEL